VLDPQQELFTRNIALILALPEQQIGLAVPPVSSIVSVHDCEVPDKAKSRLDIVTVAVLVHGLQHVGDNAVTS